MKTILTVFLTVGMTYLVSANSNHLSIPIAGSEYKIIKVELSQSNFNPGSAGTGKIWILDNSVGEAKTIKVEKASENFNEGIELYPNPTKDQLNFNFQLNKDSRIKISIIDGYGRVVSEILDEERVVGNYNVTTSINVEPGMYLVKFECEDHSTIKRLIIE